MEDVHSATSALPLGTLFLTIWRTALFLCLSSETSLDIFFSHRTSTSSAFEVITETRYINYLLTYLLTEEGRRHDQTKSSGKQHRQKRHRKHHQQQQQQQGSAVTTTPSDVPPPAALDDDNRNADARHHDVHDTVVDTPAVALPSSVNVADSSKRWTMMHKSKLC